MDVAVSVSAGPRILVVDDFELNCVLTETVLRGAAYEVDAVSDGASALSAMRAGRYDLVLMDLDMPGLDGSTGGTLGFLEITRLCRALMEARDKDAARAQAELAAALEGAIARLDAHLSSRGSVAA